MDLDVLLLAILIDGSVVAVLAAVLMRRMRRR
jgi:hypothetical protein